MTNKVMKKNNIQANKNKINSKDRFKMDRENKPTNISTNNKEKVKQRNNNKSKENKSKERGKDKLRMRRNNNSIKWMINNKIKMWISV